MDNLRQGVLNLLCKGALACYDKEKEKMFEILAGRPLSSVTEEELRDYKNSAKLWEILYNIRNDKVLLKPDNTVVLKRYKKIDDIEKHLNEHIDGLLKETAKLHESLNK